jgi:hypothetical protein
MAAADLFSGGDEQPPRRTHRPVAETLADYDRIREEKPDATTAEIAREMNYPPKYLYKLLSASGRTNRSAGKDGPPAAAPKKSRADLVTKLCDPIAKVAAAAAFAAPTLACVLIERGETTARALVAIAEDRPKMLAALENVSKVGPVSDLAETIVLAVIAAALDMGRLPIDHPLAVLTGNTARYVKMHPDAANAGPPPPPFPFTVPTPGMPVA